MNKRMRVDAEILQLAKEYTAILKTERGGRFTQGEAVKIALKKVLLK